MTESRSLRCAGLEFSAGRAPLAAALAIALAFTAYVFFTQSRFGETRHHGDSWSDMRVSLLADNLRLYGFWDMRFGIPMDHGPKFGLKPWFYVNHPAFHVVALAFCHQLGLSNDQARLFPLVFSASALVAVFLLIRRVLGGWGIALLAVVAFALCAPYRLLADAFCYQSYAFAAKTWSLAFIAYAATAGPGHRRGWLALCCLAAMCSMFLVDYEVVPAIGLFSFLFPLLLGPGGWKSRVWSAVLVSGTVAVGFVLGLVLLLAHASWILGGLRPVVDVLVSNCRWRTSTGYAATYWNRPFPLELLYRCWAYFNVHLVVIAVATVAVLLGRFALPRRGVGLLAVLFASEVAWLILVRQHSHQHVHTIFHLVLSISLLTAVTLRAVWGGLGHARFARPVFIAAVLAAAVLALSDRTVLVYGNVSKGDDYSDRWKDAAEIAKAIPLDSALIIETGTSDSSVEYFLGRPYLRRPNALAARLPQGVCPLLLTSKAFAPEMAQHAVARYRLVTAVRDLLLFDVKAGPGLMNTMAQAQHVGMLSAWGKDVFGFIMHPATPNFTTGKPMAAVLHAAFTEKNTGLGDGVTFRLLLQQPDGKTALLGEQFVDARQGGALREWVPIALKIPARRQPATLRIEVNGGPKGDFGYDWCYIGIMRE